MVFPFIHAPQERARTVLPTSLERECSTLGVPRARQRRILGFRIIKGFLP